MGASLLAILLLGAGVGVRVDVVDQVSVQDAAEITETFVSEVRTRTRGRVVAPSLDSSSECVADDHCVQSTRLRSDVDDVVLLKLIMGLRRIRIVAEHYARGAPDPKAHELDLPRDRADWRASIAQLVKRMAFVPAPAERPPPISAEPIEPTKSLVPSWIAAGAGVALLGVGIGFGLSSRHARRASQDPTLMPDAFEDYADRTQAHAIVADVLFLTAGIGLVTAIALYFVD